MYTRICALDGCGVEFQTDNKIKKHCCPAHSALNRVRRHKAKRRKKGGGNDGGGGGGGPIVIDTIHTVDPKATYTIASDKSGSRYYVNYQTCKGP